MQKRYRLKKQWQFKYTYNKGKKLACKSMVLIHARAKGQKIGLSVSKKLGNAVKRNYIKRRLREAVRPYLNSLKNGNYIIIARDGIKDTSFEQLQNAFLKLAKEQNLFIKND